MRKMCHYVVLPAHRNTITSVMFSNHNLAVERLRWRERYRPPVSREWRLCRFCQARIEDEVHALMECRHSQQLVHREVAAMVTDFYCNKTCVHSSYLPHDERLPVPVARFVFNVLAVFYSVPMYVPVYAPLFAQP